MTFGWKDIIPNDHYSIRMVRHISQMEFAYITHLYQPIIGSLSVSLYMTLHHEQLISAFEPAHGIHRGLMSLMNTSLDRIIKAREVLEAIGLLRTYKIEHESGSTYYEYHLQPPMHPAVFFGDDMMSMILLNRVGKAKYRQLREKLLGSWQLQADKDEPRTNMTKSFDQVFHSISPSELVVSPGSETEQFLSEVNQAYPASNTLIKDEEMRSSRLDISRTEPDFVFLEASLPKTLGGNRVLSSSLRAAVKELAFFYRLDDYQLSHFLQDPFIYDEENNICPDRLRRLVKEWYQKQHDGKLPSIGSQSQESRDRENKSEKSASSQQEAHRQALSRLSPISLLEQYQSGSKVSPADVKIIEELAQNYQLSSGVINVLLEYVMMTNDKKLPRALIYKIATHWKRLRIETVEQALEQAKNLYQEMKAASGRGKPEGQEPTVPAARRKTLPSKKEELPEWVLRQMKQGGSSTKDTAELDELQKKQAQELLRALGELD